ncbi:hypothetical protein BST22_11265 [Mycolicibacterium chubuense]|uniref:Luciferase-like monooxygenase n=1 Tax=Mycolicibacterium chubuense TaxID=1800 RepID=A0A0J6WB48_MYCCU|nr:hypothetical protein [Mycolicibacterium chubuense]KMO79794.1 hypothetical protein MCHUDSM44219_02656 [Mycolicibacterium chubuense]ORA52598.1 hypothetical protein BST22_11265 [Mycolicibacterium chubuense]SPX98304.1 Uncharacterised protein [Mycolicibacterium chubuense]
MRLFLSDDAGVRELTDGHQPIIRVAAPDLQRARRVRARIRSGPEDLAVILDVTVAVAGDFRSARSAFDAGDSADDTIRYAGTVDGLVGLLGDIESAGVADGVTLIAASDRQDLGRIGRDVLRGLASRDQARAS